MHNPIQSHLPIPCYRQTSDSPSKSVGVVTSVVLTFLGIGGGILCVVTVYCAPQSLFVPLVVTGATLSGSSLIGLVSTVVVVLVCHVKNPATLPLESPLASRGTQSGLPGNFLNENLRGICWANAGLQALRFLNEEFSSLNDVEGASANHIMDCVATLERGDQVSVETMERLMEALREERFEGGRAGKEYEDASRFIRYALQQTLEAKEQFLITTPFYRIQIVAVQDIVSCRRGKLDKPTSLGTVFWNLRSELEENGCLKPNLPRILIVEDLAKEKAMLSDLAPGEDGYYDCDIPLCNGERLSVKYELVGTLNFHRMRQHYTFSKKVDDTQHAVYNDASVSHENNPLGITKTTVMAFFRRVANLRSIEKRRGDGPDRTLSF